jgi:hypothetical protein
MPACKPRRLTVKGVRELAERSGLRLVVNQYAYFDGGSKYLLWTCDEYGEADELVWRGNTLADAVAFLEQHGSE